ncbi:MAG: 5-formyltetrahydrofolate cyclo-ligase [Alistipes sp.]|nr:5-formyltetrahydrofolate cyclo-ligase [Alistipes sp.]
MDKRSLRERMRSANRALGAEQRAAASAALFARVEAHEAFRSARVVAAYCALADEPDTAGVLERWVASGHRVVVPRVEGEEMQFYDFYPSSMVRGSFGIAEPTDDTTLCAPHEIDLMIVPGVAFTALGARLGRGKGYYDRYLAQHDFRAYTIGVGYAHQLTENLPTESHDRLLDEVICR